MPLRSFARLQHREEAGYYTKGGTIPSTDRPKNTSFVGLIDALGPRGGTYVHDGWFYKPRVSCISLVRRHLYKSSDLYIDLFEEDLWQCARNV